MLRFVALLALLFGFAAAPIAIAHQQTAAVVAYAQIPMFSSEAAAQRHCPGDQVVWLNIPSGIYHLKGMRWYGRTENGAYVCRREADAAGYRETRNGQ